jgi:hypothetical protein
MCLKPDSLEAGGIMQTQNLFPYGYTCNPSYLGGRDRKIAIWEQPGKKKVSKTLSWEQARHGGIHL